MITINKSQAIVVNGFLSCLLLLRRVRLPVLLINYIFMYLQLTFAVEPSPPLVGIIVGPTRCDAMRCHATRRKINNFRNGFFNDTNYEFLIWTPQQLPESLHSTTFFFSDTSSSFRTFNEVIFPPVPPPQRVFFIEELGAKNLPWGGRCTNIITGRLSLHCLSFLISALSQFL